MIFSGSSKYATAKDEDSEYSNHSHSTQRAPDISSFGVFDGHFGGFASKTCARHLHPAIVSRFSDLRSKNEALVDELSHIRLEHHDELIEFLTSEEWLDTLLGESVRAISKIMDSEIQRVDKSGTTAVSLFAREKTDGSDSIRVIISNVGDSRCVVFGLKQSVMHLRALASGPDAGIDDAKSKIPSRANMFNEVKHFLKVFSAQDALPIPLVPIASTKDHTLDNHEERSRVIDGFDAKVRWDSSPLEVLSDVTLIRDDFNDRSSSSSDPDQRLVVLIVDESGASRKIIGRYLRNLGFDFEEAENGHQACKMLRAAVAVTYAFALVIADEVVDEIKCLRDCGIADIKDIPIILLSDGILQSLPNFVVLQKSFQRPALKESLISLGFLMNQSDSIDMPSQCQSQSTLQSSSPTLTASTSLGNMSSLEDAILETQFNEDTRVISSPIEAYLSSIADVLNLIHKPTSTIKSARARLAVLTLTFLCPDAGYSQNGPDITDFNPSSPCITYRFGLSSVVTPSACEAATTEAQTKGYVLTRENSFIAKRKLKETGEEVGSDVLFGRFNDISIAMTRSIGDRYGPRRCIPLPDLIALDVKPGEFLRCVLASDGLWDVVSVHKVSLVINRYEDPKSAAEALVNKSLRRRTEKNLRLDDITVIIVDIDKTSGSTKLRARSSSSGYENPSSLPKTSSVSTKSSKSEILSNPKTVYTLQGEVMESETRKSKEGCIIS